MKPSKPSSKKPRIISIADNLNTLFDELKMACRWHRPSILMAAYKSKLVLLDVQVSLEKKLQKIKQNVLYIDVNEESFDLPLFMSRYPAKDRTVFFISGLMGKKSANPNVFRALNIRRELLVENHIRVVFWLTSEEAAAMPTQALDFWAFRHRMLELYNSPTPARIKNLIKSLDWPYWDQQLLRAELPAGLQLREELLREIPPWDEAPAMKAEIMLMLAALHWAGRHYRDSLKYLELGLDIARRNNLRQLQARYWSAIGMVNQSQTRLDQAVKAYKHSLQFDPQFAEAWGNLGAAYRQQGQTADALSATTKATALGSKIPCAWINLGDLQTDSGQNDAAVQSYKKALAINSGDASVWVKLGDAYRSMPKPKSTGTKGLPVFPWKNLGDMYAYNNRLTNARKAYKKALEIDPNDQKVIDALNACYVRKRK